MRRGLPKDLANTPTQIACGWRLHDDLAQLYTLAEADQVVMVDLLTGDCFVGQVRLEPPLAVATAVVQWLRERLDRDGVPPGLITRGTLTLRPRHERRRFLVECETVMETGRGTHESCGTAQWGK